MGIQDRKSLRASGRRTLPGGQQTGAFRKRTAGTINIGVANPALFRYFTVGPPFFAQLDTFFHFSQEHPAQGAFLFGRIQI